MSGRSWNGVAILRPSQVERSPSTHRGGIALLAVVIVVALMATAALTFALLMQESNQTARQFADQQQSQWAVDSAVETMLGLAALPPEQRLRRTSIGGDFVQSLELLPIGDSGLGSDLPAPGVGDWDNTLSEGGIDDAVDWQTALSDDRVAFDPTQPGFAIFHWQSPATNLAAPIANASSAAALSTGSGSRSNDFPASGGGSGVGAFESGGNVELELRWGWTNESSKLHLARLLAWEAAGTPASPLLQTWCGLDPQQADQLLDWLDSDEQTRPFGAERREYGQLGLGYQPANQLPASLDALLLVPQMTPTWLFGRRQVMSLQFAAQDTADTADFAASAGLAEFTRTQQAQVERDLQPLGSDFRSGERDLILELGLSARLTVSSRQKNVTRSGLPQIPVNHADLTRLFSVVSARMDPAAATYLCLARQYGWQEGLPDAGSPSLQLTDLADVELSFAQPPTANFESLVGLIDSHVRIPQTDGTLTVVTSPWTIDALGSDFPDQIAQLFEQLTVADQWTTPGRLHWRAADPALLLLIPGLSPDTQQWLLESVASASDPTSPLSSSSSASPSPTSAGGDPMGLPYQAAARYQEGLLSRSQWQILERELTDGGDVFSASVFAHAGDYRAIRWAQVIVDASGPRPRQVYYREFLPPPPTLNAILATLNDNVLAPP